MYGGVAGAAGVRDSPSTPEAAPVKPLQKERTMDASRLHVSPGTDRTPGRPGRRLLAVACASLAALATLVVATAAPASAATVNGLSLIHI